MTNLAIDAWMLEAVSQLDGDAPSVRTFVVGLGEEADCIHNVKSYPSMASDVVVAPKRRLAPAEIGTLALKDGETRQL